MFVGLDIGDARFIETHPDGAAIVGQQAVDVGVRDGMLERVVFPVVREESAMVGSNPITVIGCLDDGADGVVTCGGGGIGRLDSGPCRLLVGAIEDMLGEEGIDPCMV